MLLPQIIIYTFCFPLKQYELSQITPGIPQTVPLQDVLHNFKIATLEFIGF